MGKSGKSGTVVADAVSAEKPLSDERLAHYHRTLPGKPGDAHVVSRSDALELLGVAPSCDRTTVAEVPTPDEREVWLIEDKNGNPIKFAS